MEEMRNAYRVSVRKTEGEGSLGRPRLSWNCNIKVYLKKQDEECQCIDLAYDSDNWRAIFEAVLNLDEELSGFSERLCCKKLVYKHNLWKYCDL